MTLFVDAFRLPFPEKTVGNRFGVHDIENGRDLYGPQGHRGVDFVVPAGTPIPAIANGQVERVQWSNALGNIVVVRHYLHGDDNDVYSGYCHQSATIVRPGQDVRIGQPVGRVGSTGSAAFGAHLHLTLSPTVGGVMVGAVVDPIGYIAQHAVAPVPKTRPASTPQFTTARPGEGLWAIARRSGISLPAIEKLNPSITTPDFLVLLGQKVRIR